MKETIMKPEIPIDLKSFLRNATASPSYKIQQVRSNYEDVEERVRYADIKYNRLKLDYSGSKLKEVRDKTDLYRNLIKYSDN